MHKNGTLQTCCETKAVVVCHAHHHCWRAQQHSDMTGNDNTAFYSIQECFYFVMHAREQKHQQRRLQTHVPFLFFFVVVFFFFKDGHRVWQSQPQVVRRVQCWVCTPALRCPCNRPPRPTRSPGTTPGWTSPAPPAPAGSECPFWLWLRTETTGWRSVQEQTAGGTV